MIAAFSGDFRVRMEQRGVAGDCWKFLKEVKDCYDGIVANQQDEDHPLAGVENDEIGWDCGGAGW
jgi:hypothetical protein